MYKLSRIDDYWTTDKFIEYKIKYIMSKNYFKLISNALHLPIKDDNNENNNNIVTDAEDKIEDPRIKINRYLNYLCKRYQKTFILGYNITIDKSIVFFAR